MTLDTPIADEDRDTLVEIAVRHGTPSFVYFMNHARARIDALRTAFAGRFLVSYAMKCNPNPCVLEWMRNHVDNLDVSSSGELRAALRAGWNPAVISFTGPAKQRADLELAARSGIGEVVVESLREARALDTVAAGLGRIQRVLVRIAPVHVPKGFGSNMSGRPTQFGIDEEDLPAALDEIARLRHLSIAGFHAYSGTQCVKADAIAENWLNFVRLFEQASSHVGIFPQQLVFGSGLGIRYHEGDPAVDLGAVAAAILPTLDRLKSNVRYAQCQLLLETGRFLVGEAGIYLARVVHTKTSRGKRIVVLDGGMNHHLGAAGHLGMVIHRPYRMFALGKSDSTSTELEPQDIYGPLCTTIDTFGRGVRLPPLREGDVIGIHCSGAYGPSSSPSGFISHPPAKEFIVTGAGTNRAVQDCSINQASVSISP